MKIKGILIDLDNTLYDYNQSHQFAFEKTIQYMHKTTSISEEKLKAGYTKSRNLVHNNLHGFASSHSRLLYLQKLLEENQIGYGFILDFHNHYWDTFIGRIELFPGVSELFEEFKDRNCIVTDLTADVQFKKLIQVGLIDKVKHIVTSEEAGKEKPHPLIFYMALEKIGLDKSEVIYIGDDYDKDVVGATNLGIRTIWLNRKKISKELNGITKEVYDFKQIQDKIKSYE